MAHTYSSVCDSKTSQVLCGRLAIPANRAKEQAGAEAMPLLDVTSKWPQRKDIATASDTFDI